MSHAFDEESALFNQARALPPGPAREEFIKTACGGDTTRMDRIGLLLTFFEQDQSFLSEGPALQFSKSPPIDQPGDTIGPYRLIRVLGEGGMGIVFLAEQGIPIRRQVALKVIKPGMDSRQIVARFESERQALAVMDHVHIAKVYDAGTTANGRAYFVMEVVHGVPITKYCELHGLGIEDRLKLFLSVCDAIHHAHQKGVIHRDINPNNVLVAQLDGKPVVKVIDFGISRATNDVMDRETLYTMRGQLVGTLDYMSPEQIAADRLSVDIRTDVYGLGVLLYEMLTGTPPFERERLKAAGFDELLRIICQEEPPRPSRRLRTADPSRSDTAILTTLSSRALHLLERDLDWVVMKAIEKERDRRYDSASALSADIQRFLANEPVLASPPSPAYRLSKFYRRNRGMVLSLVAVVVSLTAGLLVAAWQLLEAREEARLRTVAMETARQAYERQQEADRRADRSERERRKQGRRRLMAIGDHEAGAGSLVDAMDWYRKAVEIDPQEAHGVLGLRWRIAQCQDRIPQLVGFYHGLREPRLQPGGSVIVGRHGLGNLDTGTRLPVPPEAFSIQDGRFTSDGLVVISFNKAQASRKFRSWTADPSSRELVQLGPTLEIEAGERMSFGLSPDGKTAVAFGASRPGGTERVPGVVAAQVRLINLSAGNDLREPVTVDFPVGNVEFDPRSKYAALTTIYDVKPGECEVRLVTLNAGEELPPQVRDFSRVLAFGFHPALPQFAVWRGHKLQLIDLQSGDILRETQLDRRSSYGPSGIAFSPDGRRLGVALVDGVAICDAGTLALQRVLPSESNIGHIAFSPDNTTVAICDRHRCHLWSCHEGRRLPLASLPEVKKATFDEEGRSLLAEIGPPLQMVGDTLLHWDLAPERAPVSGFTTDGVSWNALSDDHRFAAANGPVPRVLDLASNELLELDGALPYEFPAPHIQRSPIDAEGHPAPPAVPPAPALFSSDGEVIAAQRAPTSVQLWETACGTVLRTISSPAPITGFALDGDGKRIALISDGEIRVHDVASGSQDSPPIDLAAIQASPNDRRAEALFSRDGRLLIVATSGGVAGFDPVDSSRQWFHERKAFRLPSPNAHLRNELSEPSLCLSPRGAFVSVTGLAHVLETRTGVPGTRVSSLSKVVRFDPDERYLVQVGGVENDLHLWSIEEEVNFVTPAMKEVRGVSAAAFNREGNLLLIAGNGLQVWERETGSLIWSSEGLVDGDVRYDRCFFSDDGTEVHGFSREGRHFVRRLPADIELAEFRSIREIFDSSTLREVPDRAARLASLWEAHRTRLLASSAEVSTETWHRVAAEEAERRAIGSAARFHLSRLLARHPDDQDLRQRLEFVNRFVDPASPAP